MLDSLGTTTQCVLTLSEHQAKPIFLEISSLYPGQINQVVQLSISKTNSIAHYININIVQLRIHHNL